MPVQFERYQQAVSYSRVHGDSSTTCKGQNMEENLAASLQCSYSWAHRDKTELALLNFKSKIVTFNTKTSKKPVKRFKDWIKFLFTEIQKQTTQRSRWPSCMVSAETPTGPLNVSWRRNLHRDVIMWLCGCGESDQTQCFLWNQLRTGLQFWKNFSLGEHAPMLHQLLVLEMFDGGMTGRSFRAFGRVVFGGFLWKTLGTFVPTGAHRRIKTCRIKACRDKLMVFVTLNQFLLKSLFI